MCKQLPHAQLSEGTRKTSCTDLLRRKKRTYSNFPSELSLFWVGNKKKPFKKDNLRQSLARATQTLKLIAKGSKKCEFKNGRLQPEQYENESILMAVRKIFPEDHQDKELFTFPKPCLRLETRRPAKYRSKDRSWNTTKWEEFRSIPSSRLILSLVLDLLFESSDLQKMCKVWERTCCPNGVHEHPLRCEATWNRLKEYCRRDCGLDCDSETDETEGTEEMKEVEEVEQEPFDLFEVLIKY